MPLCRAFLALSVEEGVSAHRDSFSRYCSSGTSWKNVDASTGRSSVLLNCNTNSVFVTSTCCTTNGRSRFLTVRGDIVGEEAELETVCTMMHLVAVVAERGFQPRQ